MTRAANDLTKQTTEYLSMVDRQTVDMLIIRLAPGMEMLAQELSTGCRIYEQDWVDPEHHPSPMATSPDLRPYVDEGNGPLLFPPSPFPVSPDQGGAGVFGSPTMTYNASPRFAARQRRRSQSWMLDGMGAYPTLVIEANKVQFYSTMAELNQAISNRSATDVNKILLNVAHIISIERVLAEQVYAQNLTLPNVAAGENWQVPSLKPLPFTVISPTTVPALTAPTDEMMFQVKVQGGQTPYRFSITGQPNDLYITSDGWVRGFIEEDQWPVSGYREFLIRILAQDSSIPRQHAVLDFRYRLFPVV